MLTCFCYLFFNPPIQIVEDAMKIAFVSDVVFPWHIGGVESMEYREMIALSKKDEVYCFCLQFPGMKKEFVKDGIHYVCVASCGNGLYTKGGRRSVSIAMLFGRSVYKHLKKHKFDMLYVNAFPYFHLPAVKRYCKESSSKLVLDVVEVWTIREWKDYLGNVKGIAAYWYMKRALLGADLYVCVSSVTSSKLAGIGIPRSKGLVFAPVLDLRSISKYKSGRKSSPMVIFAGRLIKEKGLDEWIGCVSAAHSISDKINGLIVGTGPEYENVSGLIKSRHLDFISITGTVRKRDSLYKKMAASSVLLQTSRREGLSAIVLESLALGTPVILPDYTPIPEEVKRMCIVLPLGKIPGELARIASSDKSKFLRNVDGLPEFDCSAIPLRFGRIAKMLGLPGR